MIQIEDMEFYAYHGCYAEEQRVGNKFLVQIGYEYDFRQTAQNDDIMAAVNYLLVYEAVKEQMEIKSKTIENVAYRISNSLKAKFPAMTSLSVKISKINPPLGGQVGKVSFTLQA
jgi:7,8-dihydroneopterin aldolase/epimerase/oxygenase